LGVWDEDLPRCVAEQALVVRDSELRQREPSAKAQKVQVVEIEAWLDEAAQNLVAVRSSWSMSRHYLGFTSAKAAFLLRAQRCAVVVNTSPGVHIS